MEKLSQKSTALLIWLKSYKEIKEGKMENQKDIIIVGGGMVGAACAVGLGQLGLNVHLIEASPLPQFHAHSPYDLRISAISLASVQLLQQLQSWQFIEQMRVCPYRGLETWEIEGFATRFRCEELGYDKLGYMVENNVIQLGLWQALSQLDKVQSSIGVKVSRAEKCGQNWKLFLDNGEQYSAPLVIAADGANSQLTASLRALGFGFLCCCNYNVIQIALYNFGNALLGYHYICVTWQQFFPSGSKSSFFRLMWL
ncbi:Putative=2-octaprenyl-3-methyl-6-methoxy-1,4-benzoquinol hydroxylase [Avibacterium paragallinarum JF4211]|uniref:FAD-dependent oxidoreductase n=1 Tax=Avibacterium paragallinarum TaxID=728 RepID=UPI0003571E7D|nr:FAD-dependent oxidoreductase [Avibacterium paragallinarum]CDF98968.1 Putative=2-octaprenyl-3-methyl-6-methoxy-1,4-benzoquinol hydroxylase [Avibacterium paragallinarum JF4211]